METEQECLSNRLAKIEQPAVLVNVPILVGDGSRANCEGEEVFSVVSDENESNIIAGWTAGAAAVVGAAAGNGAVASLGAVARGDAASVTLAPVEKLPAEARTQSCQSQPKSKSQSQPRRVDRPFSASTTASTSVVVQERDSSELSGIENKVQQTQIQTLQDRLREKSGTLRTVTATAQSSSLNLNEFEATVAEQLQQMKAELSHEERFEARVAIEWRQRAEASSEQAMTATADRLALHERLKRLEDDQHLLYERVERIANEAGEFARDLTVSRKHAELADVMRQETEEKLKIAEDLLSSRESMVTVMTGEMAAARSSRGELKAAEDRSQADQAIIEHMISELHRARSEVEAARACTELCSGERRQLEEQLHRAEIEAKSSAAEVRALRDPGVSVIDVAAAAATAAFAVSTATVSLGRTAEARRPPGGSKGSLLHIGECARAFTAVSVAAIRHDKKVQEEELEQERKQEHEQTREVEEEQEEEEKGGEEEREEEDLKEEEEWETEKLTMERLQRAEKKQAECKIAQEAKVEAELLPRESSKSVSPPPQGKTSRSGRISNCRNAWSAYSRDCMIAGESRGHSRSFGSSTPRILPSPPLVAAHARRALPNLPSTAGIIGLDRIPGILLLVSPNQQQDKAGEYVLVEGRMPNGYPIWKLAAKKYWLYTTKEGKWGVGDETEYNAGFATQGGWILTQTPHGGVMPDWFLGFWCAFDDRLHHSPDPDITVKEPPGVSRMIQSPGMVVGR
eukprot:TRINITY_DN36530_c0_g3_i1.p1 TRINITY_DN36530_c0_g3~~TRINITY_DN36530_c0_g3_i1.p1  ORF type:complete len:852 (-),score=193.63 TRINITY_DN36530_c0_g3_i1:53-2284(-)